MHAHRLITAAVLLSSTHAFAEPTDTLPVREITAFKDGHALVLRSGEVPLNEAGDAVLTDLPRPIMGTFWASESEAGATLASVTAAVIETETNRPVTSNADLIRANIGQRIRFHSGYKKQREGVILGVSGINEISGISGISGSVVPSGSGGIVFIDMQGETAALPINELKNISFLDAPPAQHLPATSRQATLTFDLDWGGQGQQPASADISLMYIERGVRWIPSYRVTILDDDQGRVEIELRAVLINELADLDDATVHMAMGVPSFAFAGTPDPMTLGPNAPPLSMYFRQSTGSQTADMFSNALMSQVSFGYRGGGSSPFQGADDEQAGLPPELAGSERAEDLFVFTLKHVTLARGSRMSLPLITYTAPATSLYKLSLPGSPPAQALQNFNRTEQEQLAKLDAAPVATHVLRIRNENDHAYPITTAPATVFKDGRVLAQGMIRYAAPGATVDLEVGSAVDIVVKEDEVESAREPKALRWQSNDYARVDIAFTAALTNRKPHAVTVEIEKVGFGQPGDATPDASVDAINVFSLSGLAEQGAWWRWYGWPYYWHRLNGASRFRWTVEIQPGETVDLNAAWHYFWR